MNSSKNVQEKNELLYEKLNDAQFSGAIVEFDPSEASAVGAFIDDALSEDAAKDSTVGLLIAYLSEHVK